MQTQREKVAKVSSCGYDKPLVEIAVKSMEKKLCQQQPIWPAICDLQGIYILYMCVYTRLPNAMSLARIFAMPVMNMNEHGEKSFRSNLQMNKMLAK